MVSEPLDVVVEALPEEATPVKEQQKLFHIRFREGLHPQAACSRILDLVKGDAVMVQSDHGPEFAMICGSGIELPPVKLDKPLQVLAIIRRAHQDEVNRYQNLLQREQEAKRYCQVLIETLKLGMKLLQVQRYFNGSKVIFYFSAETRVDFRDLVKSLVQEFRTRVEMRQIGVRHETQMLGGLGGCGRELCCGLFMKDFVPVSIKMAKEQDLPLNPSKISGVCNRLLCCLTHEYETYKTLKKGMPKVGRSLTFEGKAYKVNSCKTLHGTVSVTAVDDARDVRVLTREEWESGVSAVVTTEKEEWQGPAKSGRMAGSRQEVGSRAPRVKPSPGRSPARGEAGARSPSSFVKGGEVVSRTSEPRAPFPPGKKAGARPSADGTSETVKHQVLKPEPKQAEAGAPLAPQPPRPPRRAKSRKKGKTP